MTASFLGNIWVGTVFPSAHSRIAPVACYLSAGMLLHVITALEMLLIFVAAAPTIDSHAIPFPALHFLLIFPLFAQLDARSRYQEYKKVRDQLILHGPDHRIFKSLCLSRCQRDAALAAARQLDYAAACSGYFSIAGYRWYHFLPDFVKHHPEFLLTATFWRTTFFAPTYEARFPGSVGIRCVEGNRHQADCS